MDRFFRGLVSGIIGGVFMNIWSLFSYHILRFSQRRFLDWSSVLLFGHLPHNWLEAGYALIYQLLWSGLLGAVFAFLIRELSTSRGLIIKGVFFGAVSGFVIYSFAVMFKIPSLDHTPFNTAVSNHIGGIIWGLVTAYSLKKMSVKIH